MKRVIVFFAVLLALSTCNSDDETLAPLPDPSFTFEDGIDRINLAAYPLNDLFQYSWTASSPLSFVQRDTREKFFFKILPTGVGGSTDVTLTISDGKQSKSFTRPVTVPPYSLTRAYGLGTSVIKEKSNDQAYEWYVDQAIGTFPSVDCGPTVVTMGIKWFDQNFTGTPSMARAAYRSEGGWWYTQDIRSYLDDNKAINYYVNFVNANNLLVELDAGGILILCLDMYYVSTEGDLQRHVHKFYDTASKGWGHFIVVKGYKRVQTPEGEKLYMEVYDPYSLGRTYDDNSMKGKNRYYLADDLLQAAKDWWPYAIVVSKTVNVIGRDTRLNPSDVPSQKGR